MAYYNFVFCTSAGDELLYEGDSDKLMRDLNAIKSHGNGFSWGRKKSNSKRNIQGIIANP